MLGVGRITAVMKVYPVAAWLARETKRDGFYAGLAQKWGVP